MKEVMIAGPSITAKSAGRKNKIMGTVNFAGREAAFFSIFDSRSPRFSSERIRSASLRGVPYFSDWLRLVERALEAGRSVRSAKLR